MPFTTVFSQSDLIHRSVGLLLLAMSVLSWVLIVWKGWLLARARIQVQRGMAAFWQASDTTRGAAAARALDASGLTAPLFAAITPRPPNAGQLAASAGQRHHLMRVLRDALQDANHRLGQGLVLLATLGATAPFVGLLGTVWGIHEALLAIAGASGGSEAMSIDRIAGPVGDALVMTAAGLAVALPAVVAYNLLGHRAQRIEATLEGLAHDLLEWAAPAAAPHPAAPRIEPTPHDAGARPAPASHTVIPTADHAAAAIRAEG